MDNNHAYFLLKKDLKNFNGQEFKKNEVLYKIKSKRVLHMGTAYIDPRNPFRRLYCADENVTRIYSREDIDTVLNIARAFVDPERYEQFTEVVKKRLV